MSRVLTSWKDIAQYMGKGVRTVQRWEIDLGLPVHRPEKAARHVVIALPDEIDDWVRRQPGVREKSSEPDVENLLREISVLREENAELRRRLIASERDAFSEFRDGAELSPPSESAGSES